jgi:hypothetical protein
MDNLPAQNVRASVQRLLIDTHANGLLRTGRNTKISAGAFCDSQSDQLVAPKTRQLSRLTGGSRFNVTRPWGAAIRRPPAPPP